VPAGDRLWFRLVCRRWAAAGAGVAQAAGECLPRGKVTRARGTEAAASVARAVMVRRVLEGQGLNGFERGICNYAAGGGCLSVLKWARAPGAFRRAARLPGTVASRSSSGRKPRGTPGRNWRAHTPQRTGISRCCCGRGPNCAQGKCANCAHFAQEIRRAADAPNAAKKAEAAVFRARVQQGLKEGVVKEAVAGAHKGR